MKNNGQLKPEWMLMQHYTAIINLSLILRDLKVSPDDTIQEALAILAKKDRGIGINKMNQLIKIVAMPKLFR